MAEKQPYTFSDFWYYNKLKIIIGGIVLILVIMFVKDAFFTPKPDITVMLVTGRFSLSDGQMTVLKDKMTTAAPDINGDGQVLVQISSTNIPDSEGDPQMYMASVQKLMAEISVGESYIYLFDDVGYEYLADMEIFDNLKVLFPELNPEEDYRISLKGLPLSDTDYVEEDPFGFGSIPLKDLAELLYLGFRIPPSSQKQSVLDVYSESQRMFGILAGGKQ